MSPRVPEQYYPCEGAEKFNLRLPRLTAHAVPPITLATLSQSGIRLWVMVWNRYLRPATPPPMIHQPSSGAFPH